VTILEAGEDIFVGMAEGVFESVGDDCDGRGDRVEEGLGRGRFRSMMAYFEDVGM
jgi:hypothetical protein